jgi:hypothetical protein
MNYEKLFEWMSMDTNLLEILLLSAVATIGLGEVLRLVLTAIFVPWFKDSFSIIHTYETVYLDNNRRSKIGASRKTHEPQSKVEPAILLSDEQIERIRARKWKEVLA